jgi:hypothetical protein
VLNPDVVFNDGLAVCDVKYKIFDAEWSRADLYQSVAFAAGYDAESAAVLGFATPNLPLPPAVRFGKIGVESIAWDIGPLSDPRESAAALIVAVRAFVVRAARRRAMLTAA